MILKKKKPVTLMHFYYHSDSEYFLGKSAWHCCLPRLQPQRAKLQRLPRAYQITGNFCRKGTAQCGDRGVIRNTDCVVFKVFALSWRVEQSQGAGGVWSLTFSFSKVDQVSYGRDLWFCCFWISPTTSKVIQVSETVHFSWKFQPAILQYLAKPL